MRRSPRTRRRRSSSRRSSSSKAAWPSCATRSGGSSCDDQRARLDRTGDGSGRRRSPDRGAGRAAGAGPAPPAPTWPSVDTSGSLAEAEERVARLWERAVSGGTLPDRVRHDRAWPLRPRGRAEVARSTRRPRGRLAPVGRRVRADVRHIPERGCRKGRSRGAWKRLVSWPRDHVVGIWPDRGSRVANARVVCTVAGKPARNHRGPRRPSYR